MKTTDLRSQSCVRCGYRMDAASSMFDDATPSPGDFTVCINCGKVMRFGPQLELQDVPTEDMLAIPAEVAHQIRQIQAGVTLLKRRN